MEKQNNNEYGQTDPDFIDQNTLVDGHNIQNEDQYKHKTTTEHTPEFGELDPDYIDQNTVVDHDNYARDEDPYHYQEGYIEDLKNLGSDFENNKNTASENITDKEETTRKDPFNSKNDKNNDHN